MNSTLALGHIDELNDQVLSFAQQLGLTSVQLHNPRNLNPDRGYWTVEDLDDLRRRCETAGMTLEGIENVPYHHWSAVQRGGPGRRKQLDNYCQTIRNMGAAGIPVLGHHFMAGYVWRTDLRALGRGGATVTSFDLSEVANGNALDEYALTPPQVDRPISADEMWDNYRIFLEAALPVAEESGVRLALHPDDPPTYAPLGGAARIMSTHEGLKQAEEMARGYPAWGLTLCLGTLSELGGADAVYRAIDDFGSRDRIAVVHFRDVKGTLPRFDECFLGEGNFNPAEALRRLEAVEFAGFIIDDHVPAMVGDRDTWIDTSAEAYCSRGRAHAIGYLQGLIQTVGVDGGH